MQHFRAAETVEQDGSHHDSSRATTHLGGWTHNQRNSKRVASQVFAVDVEKDQSRRGCGRWSWPLCSSPRLAELRKRQHATRVQVAEAVGVTQARVSRIEKGQPERREVDALAAYVEALGGKSKIVADCGDEIYVLGPPAWPGSASTTWQAAVLRGQPATSADAANRPRQDPPRLSRRCP
ncbi:helix-turn-helix domain-containing protein [Streptomyces sp. V4I8]|uniref:helix-turn-helix domain-containing protein n=1 Tax=Streptomyces sp. V4I8 TaxID=3156469 RepID=UPI0035131EF9